MAKETLKNLFEEEAPAEDYDGLKPKKTTPKPVVIEPEKKKRKPRTKTRETREESVLVRLFKNEKDRLMAAAKRLDQTPSEYIRHILSTYSSPKEIEAEIDRRVKEHNDALDLSYKSDILDAVTKEVSSLTIWTFLSRKSQLKKQALLPARGTFKPIDVKVKTTVQSESSEDTE